MTCPQHLRHSLACTARQWPSARRRKSRARTGKGKRVPWRAERVQQEGSWRKGPAIKEMDQEDPWVMNFMKQHNISPTQAIKMMGNYYDQPADSWEKTSEEEVNHISGFLKRKRGSASLLPKDSQSVLVTTSARAINIPVTLYKTEDGKIAETMALIDSRATICCIDLHFTKRMKWPLEKLQHPLHA